MPYRPHGQALDSLRDQNTGVTQVLNSIRIKTALVVGACAASFATPATAGSKDTSLTVNATVSANCSISAAPVNFGPVDTLTATAVDGTGGVTVTCTNGTGWTAAADIGAGSGASFATRRMTSSGNTLNYTLFTDSNRSIIWGDGTGVTATVGNTGSGAAQVFTVYGRVPGGQSSAPAGSYSDTVNVTITY
jgi:spore coat protein U-like protein